MDRITSGGPITRATNFPKKFEIKKAATSRRWIHIRGSLHIGDPSIQELHNFVNIYAPQKHRDKVQLWEEIQQILNDNQNEAFCIAGDLNCVLDEFEVSNCLYRKMDSNALKDFQDNNNLGEVKGENYQWYGPGERKSKLDRILTNAL